MDATSSKVSPNFPFTESSDIIVSSSDGTLFYLHRKNLETHSAEFGGVEWIPSPGAYDSDSDSEELLEVVQLTESSQVLDLLFHHIYPRPQPNLDDAEFELFAEYAEAVEKYEVFSAMDMCLHRMRRAVQSHPLLVIKYAMKHGKQHLANAAAPHTLKIKSRVVIQSLPPDLALVWFLYREHWQEGVARILEQIPDACFTSGNFPEAAVCSSWAKWHSGITRDLPHALTERDVRAVFGRYAEWLDPAQHGDCDCACHLPNNWEEEAVTAWIDMQKPFSSFASSG